jgi:cytoskeleton protein RodZ
MPLTVGQILQNKRNEQKLSLEAASSATHIRIRFLEALENDQLEIIPSSVQARGFLRLYADFLNFDVQSLLDRWDGKPPVEEIPHTQISAAVNVPTQPPPEPLPPIVEEKLPAFSATENIQTDPKTGESDNDNFDAEKKAQEIYAGIGHTLRNQRETLGLGLRDIEHYTHVKSQFLKLLEEGKINELPSLVQARGMLNNYARFLEIDTDLVLTQFAEAVQIQFAQRSSARKPDQIKSKEPTEQGKGLKKIISSDLIIGIIVIVTLMGFAVWAASTVSAARSEQTIETAPPFSQVFSASNTISETPQTPSAAISNNSGSEKTSAQVPSGSVENTQEITTGTIVSAGTGRINVYIIARQRAFLRMTVDGNVEFDGRIVPGNAYTYSGDTQIELLTGNAAALQVLYNQNDLGTLGSVGQVVNLIFTTNGVITPTPSMTKTLTITPVPSVTLQATPTKPKPSITPLIP